MQSKHNLLLSNAYLVQRNGLCVQSLHNLAQSNGYLVLSNINHVQSN
ncbi:MAG: hypothetical protein ORN55_00860 [Chitinophagaceae bacterium]|nr:hypothetical protein [Chitinophagaceae bacterium]